MVETVAYPCIHGGDCNLYISKLDDFEFSIPASCRQHCRVAELRLNSRRTIFTESDQNVHGHADDDVTNDDATNNCVVIKICCGHVCYSLCHTLVIE